MDKFTKLVTEIGKLECGCLFYDDSSKHLRFSLELPCCIITSWLNR